MLSLLTKKLFLCFYIATVSSRQICYDGYGCFQDTTPFGGTLQRPFSALPDKPDYVSTKFYLYNKLMTTGEEISAENISNYFDSSLPTKFICHGFLHNSKKKWVLDMKDAILRVENVNVITVDWSKANGFPYTQATANTQIVAVDVAKLLSALISQKNVKAADFHLIGHSLGAHIFGYAGQRVAGIGRITGLDPAGPYFENTDPIVRLDPTDALFVEAIHTDGTANLQLGLGLMQAVGHVDFYPNGGKDQPSCATTSGKLLSAIFGAATLSIDFIEDGVSCSHSAAFNYYIDTINNQCKYTAYPCNSKDDFDKGNCIKCSSKGCNRMGYWSSPSKDRGLLHLNLQTPNQLPYCLQNYQVRLTSNKLKGQTQGRGKVSIYFKTSQKTSSIEVLDDSNTTFKPESIEVRLISLKNPINDGEISSVFVSYTKTSNFMSSWLYDDKWSFQNVEIFSGDDQKSYLFCPTTNFIESGKTVEFIRC